MTATDGLVDTVVTFCVEWKSLSVAAKGSDEDSWMSRPPQTYVEPTDFPPELMDCELSVIAGSQPVSADLKVYRSLRQMGGCRTSLQELAYLSSCSKPSVANALSLLQTQGLIRSYTDTQGIKHIDICQPLKASTKSKTTRSNHLGIYLYDLREQHDNAVTEHHILQQTTIPQSAELYLTLTNQSLGFFEDVNQPVLLKDLAEHITGGYAGLQRGIAELDRIGALVDVVHAGRRSLALVTLPGPEEASMEQIEVTLKSARNAVETNLRTLNTQTDKAKDLWGVYCRVYEHLHGTRPPEDKAGGMRLCYTLLRGVDTRRVAEDLVVFLVSPNEFSEGFADRINRYGATLTTFFKNHGGITSVTTDLRGPWKGTGGWYPMHARKLREIGDPLENWGSDAPSSAAGAP